MAIIYSIQKELSYNIHKILEKYLCKESFLAKVLSNFLEKPLLRNSSELLFPKKKQAVFQEQYKILNVYSPVQKVKNKNIETKHDFSSKLKIKNESEIN